MQCSKLGTETTQKRGMMEGVKTRLSEVLEALHNRLNTIERELNKVSQGLQIIIQKIKEKEAGK